MQVGIRTPLNLEIKSPSIYDRPRVATSPGSSAGSYSPTARYYRLKGAMGSAPICIKSDLVGIAVEGIIDVLLVSTFFLICRLYDEMDFQFLTRYSAVRHASA